MKRTLDDDVFVPLYPKKYVYALFIVYFGTPILFTILPRKIEKKSILLLTDVSKNCQISGKQHRHFSDFVFFGV